MLNLSDADEHGVTSMEDENESLKLVRSLPPADANTPPGTLIAADTIN